MKVSPPFTPKMTQNTDELAVSRLVRLFLEPSKDLARNSFYRKLRLRIADDLVASFLLGLTWYVILCFAFFVHKSSSILLEEMFRRKCVRRILSAITGKGGKASSL